MHVNLVSTPKNASPVKRGALFLRPVTVILCGDCFGPAPSDSPPRISQTATFGQPPEQTTRQKRPADAMSITLKLAIILL